MTKTDRPWGWYDVIDSDKRYNGKLRGKDETGRIWYLDENEIELIQGE